MAFKIVSEDTIEVICSNDPAVNLDESDYDEYLKTLDKQHLVFVDNEEPTIFVMKTKLKYGVLKTIQEAAMKVTSKTSRDQTTDPEINVEFNTHINNEYVRHALVDIKNPSGLPKEEGLKYKRGKGGVTDDDTMAELLILGCISDLGSAFNIHSNSNNDRLKKK